MRTDSALPENRVQIAEPGHENPADFGSRRSNRPTKWTWSPIGLGLGVMEVSLGDSLAAPSESPVTVGGEPGVGGSATPLATQAPASGTDNRATNPTLMGF